MLLTKYKISLLLFLVSLSLSCAFNGHYSFARVESCSGCSLNSLPDVKNFIFNDLPSYEFTEFKPIQGAKPELVLFDKNNEEVERLTLSHLTREECNDLMISKGFKKRIIKDEV